jgi:hypothetical protein
MIRLMVSTGPGRCGKWLIVAIAIQTLMNLWFCYRYVFVCITDLQLKWNKQLCSPQSHHVFFPYGSYFCLEGVIWHTVTAIMSFPQALPIFIQVEFLDEGTLSLTVSLGRWGWQSEAAFHTPRSVDGDCSENLLSTCNFCLSVSLAFSEHGHLNSPIPSYRHKLREGATHLANGP